MLHVQLQVGDQTLVQLVLSSIAARELGEMEPVLDVVGDSTDEQDELGLASRLQEWAFLLSVSNSGAWLVQAQMHPEERRIKF